MGGLTSPKGELGLADFDVADADDDDDEDDEAEEEVGGVGETAIGAHLWRFCGDLWWSWSSGSKSSGRFNVAQAMIDRLIDNGSLANLCMRVRVGTTRF